MLSTNQTNPFCNSWAQQLRSGHNFNALQLKKAINEKKHKVANELIQVQKLITDAKYDNYCLYVVHAKLARNKNQDILLKLLGRDTTNDEAAAQVVLLLEGFRKEGLMAK